MCPKFVSKEGVWLPTNERAVLKNVSDETIKNPSSESSKYAGEEVGPGEDFIYEGPDRAALEMLKELDASEVGFIGQHFSENMDLFELARSKGYPSVEDYVERMGYKSDKAKELADKYMEQYNLHKPKEKKKVKEYIGGGTNTAGGDGSIKGGFGDTPSIA